MVLKTGTPPLKKLPWLCTASRGVSVTEKMLAVLAWIRVMAFTSGRALKMAVWERGLEGWRRRRFQHLTLQVDHHQLSGLYQLQGDPRP